MASKDIRKASPREQARWLRERGWEQDGPEAIGTTWWFYGARSAYGEHGVDENFRLDMAIDIEFAAEALRRKRAKRKP